MMTNKIHLQSALDMVEMACDQNTVTTISNYIEGLEKEIQDLLFELDCYDDKPIRRVRESDWD